MIATLKTRLFGNGIDDDAPAIQEMLDCGASCVRLPVPEKCYCIGKTLMIHSGQSLILEPQTVIRLLPRSNCFMLANEYNAHDISVTGGIWDYDNLNQAPNPQRTRAKDRNDKNHWDGNPDTVLQYQDRYEGVIMRFLGVERLSVSHITFKNPVTYCLQIAEARFFTIENLFFDMNHGNPDPMNMDGVHIDGRCRFGSIRNLKGTCYDDVVALNADDGHDGPIEDIEIDGIFALHSLRAIRLLSTKSKVRRISISNIFGTYYRNAVTISYFYPFSGRRGQYDMISIRNVYASICPYYDFLPPSNPTYPFSYINIDPNLEIGHLEISVVHRREENSPRETLKIGAGTNIEKLSLTHFSMENNTPDPITMIRNEGCIRKLYLHDIQSGTNPVLDNQGKIDNIFENTP